MSLHPHIIAPVPEETARAARAAFPKGHPYLTLRDGLGTIFQDEDFAPLFPAWGHPGLPPWRPRVGDHHAIPGKLGGSPGGGGGPRAHRLEVSAESLADGPGLRLFGPERIPGPPASRER